MERGYSRALTAFPLQMIVVTPEKWDIITRKSGDRTYTQKVPPLNVAPQQACCLSSQA